MTRLRHTQLRQFSHAVGELHETVAPELLSDHLLRGIARLIPVDRVSYNESDRATGRVIRAHSLGDPPSPALVESLNAHIHQHPGFSRPGNAPMMISDTLSQRQFRQLGLYQEHFKLYGIHYQLGAGFAAGEGTKISFGLNRQSRDFTEEDRLMLALLCPHLARAGRRARANAELRAGPLQCLGLSAREAQVLLWLAQGKRNAEIAAICQLRTSTVTTHVRNIFPKLGVETRTAAAAAAWRTLSS